MLVYSRRGVRCHDEHCDATPPSRDSTECVRDTIMRLCQFSQSAPRLRVAETVVSGTQVPAKWGMTGEAQRPRGLVSRLDQPGRVTRGRFLFPDPLQDFSTALLRQG